MAVNQAETRKISRIFPTKSSLIFTELIIIRPTVLFICMEDVYKRQVQERAVGQDVMNGLNPGQMVIKIVNEELVSLMGSETTELPLKQGNEITVIIDVSKRRLQDRRK